MNKYQEALDHLCQYEIAYKVSCKESIGTLQELIDNYQEECDYHGEVLHDKEEEIAKLNKALDKACEELVKLERFYLETSGCKEFSWSEEEWKKYLLRGN